jgi:putative selenate reductase
MDAARTAQRLTRQPSTIVYRRSQAEMPAEEEELRDLLDEGNHLLELVSPSRVVLRDGRVVALECVRTELGEVGPDGRRRPIRVEGSEFEIEADSIILAIGQRPDIAFLDGSGVTLGADGAVIPNPATGQVTSSVYAGGDVTRGPAIIIQACADGRRAAEAICREFGVQFEALPARSPELTEEEIVQVRRARARRTSQNEPELLPVALREGFDLVEQTLTESAARAEAARCLQCSTNCDKCVEVCPNRANYTYHVSPVELTLPLLSCRNGGLDIAGEETFKIEQSRQIIHVDDFCNECGNCATFCVHEGKPYTEKPRLFLRERDYQLEDDNAFYIEGSTIRRRESGRESRLSMTHDAIVYENAQLRIGLTSELQVREMALTEAFEGTASLKDAAEMASILKGVTSSAAFLLK